MTDEVRWTRPDAPEVAGMMAELLHEYVSRYGPAARERMERFPDESLTPPHGRLVVLLRDGIAVAGGAFRRHDAETAELKRIWTHSSQRRRGLARRVLLLLEAEASWLDLRPFFPLTDPRSAALLLDRIRPGDNGHTAIDVSVQTALLGACDGI
ncbi:GNAT family N-acetyltransferase [Lentzea sp. CC55]|uniref:GNAT family N-acetyltransferase n=1 Tax=Lentzea sp. CC55 TaxID=2884909 RepID=UPI001F307660|nr:GNAT family N-acetyltransferase [Lentzea sp. CC55]MCG8928039.1 GNAT family N-acetyltransferase [Lentzea sp. CC55]